MAVKGQQEGSLGQNCSGLTAWSHQHMVWLTARGRIVSAPRCHTPLVVQDVTTRGTVSERGVVCLFKPNPEVFVPKFIITLFLGKTESALSLTGGFTGFNKRENCRAGSTELRENGDSDDRAVWVLLLPRQAGTGAPRCALQTGLPAASGTPGKGGPSAPPDAGARRRTDERLLPSPVCELLPLHPGGSGAEVPSSGSTETAHPLRQRLRHSGGPTPAPLPERPPPL